MTDRERVEELERIVAEYAALYGLSQKARRYFAEEGKRKAQLAAGGEA